MVTIHPQYIKDSAGNNLVVLSQNDFDALIEELEELEDIRLYDKAKNGKQEFVAAEEAFKEIEEKRKKR